MYVQKNKKSMFAGNLCISLKVSQNFRAREKVYDIHLFIISLFYHLLFKKNTYLIASSVLLQKMTRVFCLCQTLQYLQKNRDNFDHNIIRQIYLPHYYSILYYNKFVGRHYNTVFSHVFCVTLFANFSIESRDWKKKQVFLYH